MKKYIVGGAVRDQLLGYPVLDRDWVVIGESPESMLARGYRAVGKDFPVFLHPDTHEEHALARTERKVAPGYKGFIFNASSDVSLEEDLIRRDLTINAIAMDEKGRIVDPYQGQADLQNKIFRHVSEAFAEDPVRILRVARFAARYAHLGFRLADETRELMIQMTQAGETRHLVAERVWAELYKALGERQPAAFFNTLRECRALSDIFPEIEALFGIPQPEQHHPEIDTGVHCLMVLEQAALLTDKPEVRLAALLHDLGKAKTPPEDWPRHHGHETLGLPILEEFCRRLRAPKAFFQLNRLVMRYHTHCHRIYELRAAKVVDILQELGAYKNSENLQNFLLACEADMKGRTGFEQRDYPQAAFLLGAAQAANAVDIAEIVSNKNLSGAKIGEAIRQQRIAAVKRYIGMNAVATA